MMNEESAADRRPSFDDGLPWWVKAIFLMGVPSAIACYLVYALVSAVVPGMLGLQEQVSRLAIQVGSVQTDHASQKVQNDRIIAILQASCANAAKDNFERDRCFQ